MKCPNKTHPDYKKLALIQPKIVNYLWVKYDGNVPAKYYNIPSSRETTFQKISEQSAESIIASEKTIKDLAARMSDRIGIPIRFESDRTKEYKGKLENGVAVVNLAYATLDTPIHEILGHPIIRAIKQGNTFKIEETLTEKDADKIIEKNQIIEKNGIRYEAAYDAPDGTIIYRYDKNIQTKPNIQLYQNLLKELEYGKGKEVLDRIKRDYVTKDYINPYYDEEDYEYISASSQKEAEEFILDRWESMGIEDGEEAFRRLKDIPAKEIREKYTLEEQQEEAIVELLGLMTAEKLDNVKDGKLISLLKRLLKEMKAFMKDLLRQREVDIDKLPDNMTLGDLSDLLAYSNSKLILPEHEVIYTTPDNQQFKTYVEASKHISELTKSVEDVDLNNVNLDKISIKNFIDKNKEYEQSKEIIEEWKKVNNIQYNPEEIYSRGQEFTSVVGAYSNFDVDLMMQNLLQHIEDNEKAGTKFAISAFTKPINKTINHLEGGGGKIKFKIYPKSEDILWASNTDVYSGSVWDASKKFNKDKKSELLGVSYTKYPSLAQVTTVSPNLASIVDNLAHHHNELGIVLTGNNFRLEYDEHIPTSTKKIINAVNSILDQKYGKLVKPEIRNPQNNDNILDFITERNFKYYYNDNTGNEIEISPEKYNELKKEYKKGVVQPIQTNNTLKESITNIKSKLLPKDNYDLELKNYNQAQKGIIPEFYSAYPNINGKEIHVFALNSGTVSNEVGMWQETEYYEYVKDYIVGETQNVSGVKFWVLSDKFKQEALASFKKPIKPVVKENTSQAIINTKIAKLKEVAKKYPRSLVRSEVVRTKEYYPEEFSGFAEDELPFQKIPSTKIKEGVSELFESNPELANSVYEALGFEIPTTKLQGRKLEYDELNNPILTYFDVVQELTSNERESLPSSILIKKLLNENYLPKINETDIVLGVTEGGIWRPNLKKIEAAGNNKSTLAKKIAHELLHSVTGNIILSYQNLKGDFDFTDKYAADQIKQGYIKPVKLNKIQIEALDNLVRLRTKVIDYIERNKETLARKNRGFGNYDYFIHTNYTDKNTDLHEFISEVFSNPELINILKKIPTEGKKSNLFRDFVDAIAKILGFNNTSILEDIIAYSEEAFFAQPQITPQQKQQAQQLYSQYLSTIFPNSKVKDIVYRGQSNRNPLYTDRGIYFSKDKTVADLYSQSYNTITSSYLLNITSPKTLYLPHLESKKSFENIIDGINVYSDRITSENINLLKTKGFDGVTITEEEFKKLNIPYNEGKEIIVFEPSQIHILGNKEDLEGFKQFVTEDKQNFSQPTNTNEQEIELENCGI